MFYTFIEKQKTKFFLMSSDLYPSHILLRLKNKVTESHTRSCIEPYDFRPGVAGISFLLDKDEFILFNELNNAY